jgi:tripartite ATP-independent transporter DctM subunit
MQNSGVGYSIYETMSQLLGSLKGGLAIGTIIATTLIAALSGIGATGTSIMGMVALPEMYKRKYNKGIVLGCIAAGGALGPLIPPSVLMIIVGGYADLSVGRLFLGGIVPGLIIALLYCVYIGVRCYIIPLDGPALRKNEVLPWVQRLKLLKNVMLPILLAFFILLVIYMGICTPTEASSIGVLGTIIIIILNKRFNWENIKDALLTSLKVTSMVMWILLGGGCYSALVTSTGTSRLVSDLIMGMSLGPTGTVLVILVIPFIMGMFIDPIAIVMICVPIFLGIIKAMGLDLLWVMLLFIIVVIIGYISPPFGVNLFYMKGVAPAGTKIMDVYKGIIPFVLIKVVILAACVIWPSILLFLPSILMR